MRISPYHTAAFLGSFLLFEIELLIAKLLLPRFGGSAQVWTTCMMFFQGALLLGYLYARVTAARLSVRAQAKLHLALIALAAVSFPVGAAPAPAGEPVAALLAALAVSIGAPFFVLSATVPVIQRWLSASGRPESADPYTLYAASNAGALAALIAYPFLIEPLLPLGAQLRAWEAGYVLFAAAHLLFFPAASLRGSAAAAPPRALPVPWKKLLAWGALSAGPCAAMLAATRFLTSDMAAVPLLWMAPLAIYLGTFILYFRRGGFRAGVWGPRLAVTAAAASCLAAVTLLGGNAKAYEAGVSLLGFILNLGALFVIAMLCHRSLAADKPAEAGSAPSYYLAIAVGGFLAGVLMGIGIPVFGRGIGWAGLDWLVAGALSLSALVIRDWEIWRAKTGFRRAALPAGAALAAVLALAYGVSRDSGPAVRNFYGITKVEKRNGMRILMHGNTMHGLQYLDKAKESEPLLYYHKASPAGDVFRLFGGEIKDAGLLGLGAGTLAAYGRRGMKMTFYELDPDVAFIAGDYFSFLSRSKAEVWIVAGDGRLSLEKARGLHDLIVLDAYNSGAVPAHLLTREAFEIYLRRLAPGGLILCHISNRYLDLKPVMAAAAQSLGLYAAVRTDNAPAGREAGAEMSQWAAFSRDGNKTGRLKAEAGWKDAAAYRSRFVRPWTDRYASILPLIRF